MPIELRKPVSNAVKADYRVIKQLSHGGLIHGARREIGDIVALTPNEAQFLLLNETIEPLPPTPPATPAAKAKPAQSDAA